MNLTSVSPRAIGLALLVTATLTHAQPADPFKELATWQFGKSREPLALIEEQIRKTAPADFAAIEVKLLPVLQSPETPKDAKRYICRWLAVVGSANCVPDVAPLLADADLSHPARMALEPMPNAAAGAALRQVLPKLQGKLLAGVVASIGMRRDAEAVPALSDLAKNSDPLIAETALRALGEIGTVGAASALEKFQAPPGLAHPLARARITAAGHLAAEGQRPQAATLYRSLVEQTQQTQAIRVAALKGLIGALPQPEAVQLVTETLQSDEPALREATLSAFVSSRDQALKTGVAQQLPGLRATGQIVLLGVLADDPSVAARAAVLKTFEQCEDVPVRVAAVECLARHGQAEDVAMLVRLAQSPTAPLAEAARQTLQRLSGAGVDAALVRWIEAPEAGDRAVGLSTLASRRMESALPTLARLVAGTDLPMATEAAKALGVMGKTDQLAALAQVLVRTENAGLREAAEQAAASVCRRATDKRAAATTLLAALDQAKTAPARVSLLPLLVMTGGEPALVAVSQAVQSDNADVRDAAVRALVAWPDASAMAPLVALARSASHPTHAILALRDGCLRLAAMEETPLARRVELYRSVLELAQRPEEKKQAMAGLAQVPSVGALELLQNCAKDAALRNDALVALLRLARQIGSVYPKPVMAALEEIKAQATAEDIKKQVEQAIKAVQNAGQSPEGFIVVWMLSGPYQQEGKGGGELFDMAFAPEKPDGKAEWRPVTAPAGGRAGLIELDKVIGGDNRVAYLRTQITSEQEQEARLELGSDDGIKVWLNGKAVHANNATRPNSPNQDKAKVKLKQGPNTLLLKVTQGGGEWSACCRLRAADGTELSHVSVAPNAE